MDIIYLKWTFCPFCQFGPSDGPKPNDLRTICPKTELLFFKSTRKYFWNFVDEKSRYPFYYVPVIHVVFRPRIILGRKNFSTENLFAAGIPAQDIDRAAPVKRDGFHGKRLCMLAHTAICAGHNIMGHNNGVNTQWPTPDATRDRSPGELHLW